MNPERQWNRKRRLRRWARKLSLAFLFLALNAAAAVAQTSGPSVHADGSAILAPNVSTASLDRAIALAADYFERTCSEDGRFVYRVQTDSGNESRSYNIIRHAGAIYALGMLNRSDPDEQTVKAMDRAAQFMRLNYIGPGVRPGQLVVWSKPLPMASTAELGATGLGLVALAAIKKAEPNSVPLEQLQSLGRFLLFLQRSDGSFISKYREETGADPSFESLYYPGEAALGLISLYEIDRSAVWLNAAARALSYLARSRAGQIEVPPDHWALIATARLLPLYARSNSPASRQELIQHAIQICHVLMKNQIRNPVGQGLDGSFDPSGRTAPTATRMEGLLAALEFLPPSPLRGSIKICIDHGIGFLIRTQFRYGPYSGGVPAAYVQGTSGSTDIRIDYVQHALCAWLRYRELMESSEGIRRH